MTILLPSWELWGVGRGVPQCNSRPGMRRLRLGKAVVEQAGRRRSASALDVSGAVGDGPWKTNCTQRPGREGAAAAYALARDVP